MSQQLKTKQKGFTIIELMIATTVFAMVLLLCTFAIIKIGNIYYKSTNQAKTQEATRSIMDRITQDIQFGSNGQVNVFTNPDHSLKSAGGSYGFCIGNHRYSYYPDHQLVTGIPDASLNQTNHAFVVDTRDIPCSSGQDPLNLSSLIDFSGLTEAEELLPSDSRILPYDSTHSTLLWSDNGGTVSWNIGISIVHGGDNGLLPGHLSCISGDEGRFCAVSQLSSTVGYRVKSN